MKNSFFQKDSKIFTKTKFSNFSQSGYIQTLHDQNYLGKSRIQNLPNHKRQNLSSKLDIVVVFQTIQIERLSVEIQALRVKLKDSERQILNYLSYQIQIKQLTQNCIRLEQQKEACQNQIQKLNIICQKMYSQLQEVHQKSDGIYQEMSEKLKNMKQKSAFSQQKIAQLKKENFNLYQERKLLMSERTQDKQQWNKKLIVLSQEIKRLNQILLKSSSANNEISKQNHLLKEQKAKLLEQMKIKNKMNEKNNQIKIKLQEIERVCQEKIVMISQLKVKIQNLYNNFKNQEAKNQQICQYFVQNVNKIQKINQQLSKQIKWYQQNFLNLKKINQQKQFQMANQLMEKTKCIQQTSQKYQNLRSLYQDLKKSFSKIQSQRFNEMNFIKQQIGKYKESIEKSNLSVIQMLKRIQKKQSQITNLKGQINREQLLASQNKAIQQKYTLIISQLQKNYIQLDKQKNNSYMMEKKIIQIEGKIGQKDTEISFLNNQSKNFELRIDQITKQKMLLEQLVKDKQKTLGQYQIKARQQFKNNQMMQQKIQKNVIQLQKAYKQLDYFKKRIQEQQVCQNNQLQKQLKKLKLQSQQQQKQICSLKTKMLTIEQYVNKVKEIQKRRQAQMKQHNQKLKKINQTFSMNEIFVEKILTLQNQIGILQNQNMKLSGENKLMSFEMVQTHKINTMYKRRDSTKTTCSLKSQNQISVLNSENSGERQILQSLIIRN